MDDLDQDLLLLLVKDARASAADMARHLKVSRGTVQNRIDKLVQTGVIERFTVEFGETKEDHQISAFALVQTHAEDDKVVVASLRRMAEIVSVSTLSGSFDIVVELRCASLARLDEVLDHLRGLTGVAKTQSHIRLRSWGA